MEVSAPSNQLSAVANPKINNIVKLVFFISVLDILFFPYIRIASASISMILLPIWYIFNLNKIKITTDFKMFIPFSFFVITSLMFSFIFFQNEPFLFSNIKYAIFLMYGFLYYFFFKFYIEESKVHLGGFLGFYIFFGFSLALVYFANINLYFKLRTFWTLSGNAVELTDYLIMNRFTSTYSDPNNAATVFVAVLAYLLFNSKQSFFKNLVLVTMTGVIISATMSATGFILYGITLAFYLLKTLVTKNFFVIKKSTFLTIIFLLFLSPFIYMIFNAFLDSIIVQTAIERVFANSADSRFLIWQMLLEEENIFKYIFLGMGGSIIVNDAVYAPHNGNLHLIYNYGMITYVLFMCIFFRKRKNTTLYTYLFIIVFFIGFTMNVGIYENRFINLLVLLVAGYAGMSKHRTEQKYKNSSNSTKTGRR